MATEQRATLILPAVGHPESHYAKLAHDADRVGDPHGHEAAKVGQYLTLAREESLTWEDKLKYYRHALKRHCQTPALAEAEVEAFYGKLADLVRQHAGMEALRIASGVDDLYAARLSMGQSREQIEDEAEEFFAKILGSGDHCPEHFNEADWQQLKLIRDQWI